MPKEKSPIQVSLDVNQILLDTVNPRHDPLDHQTELVEAMIEEQKEKLVHLGEDINNYGMNPTDLVSVIAHESEKDKFVVVEGNRRMTVLNLLVTPSLCQIPALRKKFEALSKVYLANPINKIRCVLFPDRESAKHWISLKHTGENDGAGTVGWDSTMVKRFQAQDETATESVGLQVMNFLLEYGDKENIDLIKNMPITTVERLLKDPEVREFLGLVYETGKLSSRLTKKATAEQLYKFFAPILTREKNVNDVYYKKNRKQYMDDHGKPPVETPANLAQDLWKLESPPKSETKKTEPPQRSMSVRNQPQSINRKYLIPRDCKINIPHKRANAIYGELRTDLIVDRTRNACAVLLRVFLELSVDLFADRHPGTGLHANDSLVKKLEKITKYMEAAGMMTDAELKPVKLALNQTHGLFSTNTLNAYVHNPEAEPIPTELKMTWDRMENFIKKLWS